ncbi:SGNH/GDSL hydrolase family protein [Desulfohalovibrio reitneri]|uniref:SGNH/GDSL hydrolase family protein n=1 Tax=Desulfohalovibrio reitneri TaxID=1307759 RepID=UPI0004A77333|nr:SGNH/GDSL hydrolase family protein [Desulfohalovibrio reitneri]
MFFLYPDEPNGPVKRILALGDSLSDLGPPHGKKRYSDGEVWLETLAKGLRLPPPDSRAFGGARTGYNNYRAEFPRTGLQTQVEGVTPDDLQPGTLTALWCGFNDLHEGTGDPASSVANILRAMGDLAEKGARTFLVLNLFDPTRAPAFNDTEYAKRGPAARILVEGFNRELAAGIALMRSTLPDIAILPLDAAAILEQEIPMGPGEEGDLYWVDHWHFSEHVHQALGHAAALALGGEEA